MDNALDRPLRLGTRASALARWQADWVASRLQEQGVPVEIVLITTSGDVSTSPLSQVGGQGLFTKEIQRALLDDRIDLAVHSLKDLPTEPIEGLQLAAVPPRESPQDVLVSRSGEGLDALPSGARIGTGSRRRQSQLLHYRPDLIVSDIRGNVDTRLRRVDDGDFAAIVLAEAGLKRLGWAERVTQVLPLSVMLSAVGQGALGIETRSGDARTLPRVAALNDPATQACVLAERAVLAGLRAGCLAPVAALGRVAGERLTLHGAVLSLDGQRRLSVVVSGAVTDPAELGAAAAKQLLDLGAGQLIADSRAVG